MTQKELDKFTASKNLIISTLKEKSIAQYAVLEQNTNFNNQKCLDFVLNKVKQIDEKAWAYFKSDLTLTVDRDYINFRVKCEKYGTDKIAEIYMNRRFYKTDTTPETDIELRCSHSVNIKPSDPRSFDKLNQYLALAKVVYHNSEEFILFSNHSCTFRDEYYETCGAIERTEREIRDAKSEFDKSIINRLIYVGSEIQMGEFTGEKRTEACFGAGNSRRRGYHRRGIYFTKMKITKMTPAKVYVEFIREYLDPNNDNMPNQYVTGEKKLTREVLKEFLNGYRATIISLNAPVNSFETV